MVRLTRLSFVFAVVIALMTGCVCEGEGGGGGARVVKEFQPCYLKPDWGCGVETAKPFRAEETGKGKKEPSRVENRAGLRDPDRVMCFLFSSCLMGAILRMHPLDPFAFCGSAKWI